MENSPPPVSPEATGDAGGTFEREVGAGCLATLLTGGIALFTSDISLTGVTFQTRNLGWRTDDFLLEGVDRAERICQVAIQVKHEFALQPSDPEAVSVICGAFKDFSNSKMFDATKDRLALVVRSTTKIFERGIRTLGEAARSSTNAEDFAARLTPGVVTQDARDVLTTLRTIFLIEGIEPAEEQMWRFLRVFYVARLDFGEAAGSTLTLVKSLLAATNRDQLGASIDTWNELFVLSAEAARSARRISWDDLPEVLRTRHRTSPADDRESLKALTAASDIVRRSVSSSINGQAHLPRRDVVADVLTALNEDGAVIVIGEPGAGKSAVAAEVYDILRGSSLAFAMRADSLATAHLATALADLGARLSSVLPLFSMHREVFVWIESGERLFEKSELEREAFGDFLRMIKNTGRARVLVTCRQYSADIFRSAALERCDIASTTVVVPRLSEEEVAEVARQIPTLQVPLSAPAIRELLRNSFYLDLAARMSWSADDATLLHESAFRRKAWNDVVCKRVEAASGLPIKRDKAMVEICLARARALTPYVSADSAPEDAVHKLVVDGLLVEDADPRFVSPAHDVFEDWALLQWLDRLFRTCEGVNAQFFETMGYYPALRRTYRRWLSEWLQDEPDQARQAAMTVIRSTELSNHWKDDTLVALLQAPQVNEIFSALKHELYESNCELLLHSLHLLRLSCRQPHAVEEQLKHSLLLPGGRAWEMMLRIVAEALPNLPWQALQAVLEFVEEAAVIAREEPTGPASVAISKITEWLLTLQEHVTYRAKNGYIKRVINVMLAIPIACDEQLRNMVTEALGEDQRTSRRAIREGILDHVQGAEVARLRPDLTEQFTKVWLELDPPRLKQEQDYHRREDLERVFGFRDRLSTDDYPASAWQGPLFNLLTYHPQRGTALILEFLNRAVSSYANASERRIERPAKVALRLDNNGTVIEQYASPRLWTAYRGHAGVPNIIKSAAMALEAWLLEKAARGDADLGATFTTLLTESNSVIVTAVLASVALSAPRQVASAAVPLLTCRVFFDMDRVRWMQDSANFDFGPLNSSAKHVLLNHERKQADSRKHRRYQLEDLALLLQVTEACDAVYEVLDVFLAELPAETERTKNELLWSLALHRMDARKFIPISEEDRRGYVPGPIGPVLSAFVERESSSRDIEGRRLALVHWGIMLWEHPAGKGGNRPEVWREKLAEVRQMETDPVDPSVETRMVDSGAVQIAAVCLRDHQDALMPDERSWCFKTLLAANDIVPDGDFDHGMVNVIDGGLQAAYLLPLLLEIAETNDQRRCVLETLCRNLCQTSAEVQEVTAIGIREYLFNTDANLAESCIEVIFIAALRRAEFDRRWMKRRRGSQDEQEDFRRALFEECLNVLVRRSVLNKKLLLSADYRRFPYVTFVAPLVTIFQGFPSNPMSAAFFLHLANLLVDTWRTGGDNQSGATPNDDQFRFEAGEKVTAALTHFVLVAPNDAAFEVVGLLVSAAADCPYLVSEFLLKLVTAEDRLQTIDRFWLVWERFATSFLAAHGKFERNDHVEELVSALLLGNMEWKVGSNDWPTLRGNGHRVTRFFDQLPTSAAGISTYVLLVCRFQKEFVSTAFIHIAAKLGSDEAFLFKNYAKSALEETLVSLVYGGAASLRQPAAVRDAVLLILDYLVESGSSVAFRVRDDFVTPLMNVA